MKFLRIPGLDQVNALLTHETYDRRIIGGCDIFATKPVATDRRAYKELSTSLDTRYATDLATSQSMGASSSNSNSLSSPLTSPDNDDRKYTLSPELLLSSPFGPLNEPNSKKIFSYLLGTLNAVHPDYDFFGVLRPWDFKRERSLRKVMADFDGYFTASTSASNSAGVGPTRGSSAVRASTGMWALLDREMDLRSCQIWSYRPEDDDLLLEDESDQVSSDSDEDEDAGSGATEGTLWSVHYFFYNKQKKRVAYLHLRCCARKVVMFNGSTPDLSIAGVPQRKKIEDWGGMEEDMEMDDNERLGYDHQTFGMEF